MEHLKKNKEYVFVPVSMILAGIYVYYNTKSIKRTLVDPGDGSPEVMEISEESAKVVDYVYTSGAVGVFVFACIYLASNKNKLISHSQTPKQFSPQLPPQPRTRTFNQESIRRGPADY